MSQSTEATFTCRVCGKVHRLREGTVEEMMRPPTEDLLKRRVSDWAPGDRLCFGCLADLRADFVHETLAQDRGGLSALQAPVIMMSQNRLLGIQRLQMDMMEEIARRAPRT